MSLTHYTVEKDGFCGLFSPATENRNAAVIMLEDGPPDSYLCNLDHVMFGVFGVPLFREHTCFEDGDYCDFKLKMDAKPMTYWLPVFTQGKGYK